MSTARNYGIVLLFLLMGANGLSAQDPVFSTVATKEGLPSNVIAGVAQDDKGFIWIGTGNGVARYDGNKARIFRKDETPLSLPSNQTSCIVSVGAYIWVGTWNGLCKINTVTFEVIPIDLGGHNVIRTLYKDPRNNNVWIGTATGLIRHSDTELPKVYTSQNSGLSHNTIRAVHLDKSGTLWVGTYDKLNKLPEGADRFVVYDLKGSYKSSLKNNLICDIKPGTSDSHLWVGTETGLCLFDVTTGTYKTFNEQNTRLSNEVVKTIYVDHVTGKLWLGSDFGLNLFDPTNNQCQSYFHNPRQPFTIANNVTWQIFEDKGNVLWFVTSNGLSKLNKYPPSYDYHEVSYRLDDQLIGNQVKSVLITKEGILWLATLHGIVRIDQKKNEKTLFDTQSPVGKKILLNNVFALEEDESGRIWIGTAGGINIWDEKKQRMHAITSNATNGLTSNYIARFMRGPDGSFWVSAWEGGLYKVTGSVEKTDDIRFAWAGDFGSEKSAMGSGNIWIVKDNELYRVDPANFQNAIVPAFNRVAARKDIHCLYFSTGNHLWAGTANGMIEYDPATDSAVFHPVNTGVYVNIGSVAEDRTGNIWATGQNSILKFAPASRTFELFPLDKDLPLKNFFDGCVANSADGKIIFGGDNGYLSLQPDRARPNPYSAPIYITALEINNRPVNPHETIDNEVLLDKEISFTQELELDYAQRSLTFEFSALHYWQPSANIYAYRLQGFDNDWNYVSGSKNFAVYSNLQPGDYVLNVRGTNNYGVWSAQQATMQIRVKPPLFLSTWFIALYVVIVLVVLIVSFRIYTARIHLGNELKIARLEKEHTEEIAQTKQQFFTNISHELRTPISLILPPIRQVIKHGNLDEANHTLITLAEKNSQRLLRLVNQILDFRKLENESLPLRISSFDFVGFVKDVHALFVDKALRSEIDFTFHSSTEPCKVWADKEKIETVFFNLLSNAFKFTPRGGAIHVVIHVAGPRTGFPEGGIEVTVKDSGIGIQKEEIPRIFERFYQTSGARQKEVGYGIGLTLAAEYTKLHHGEIAVESEPGSGTSFRVLLPLGNSHFPIDFIHDDEEVDLLATKAIHTPENGYPRSYRFDLPSDKPLVLLVENNTELIDFIKVSLKSKYHFITAENGEEGLQKLTNFSPDIIVSDIMMPVMDGIAFCKKIKEDHRNSHVPIILLTARSLTSQKVEGIRVGADAYLTKPFEAELLEANVDHLLERKKELMNYFRNELLITPQGTAEANQDKVFVDKVMSLIEAHISDTDFGVEALSQLVGISSTHLYRKLKSLTHLTANDVIKKYRIKKASLLLKNKAGNISEIMYEVGFSSLSYFSKCFKAEYGLSPKEYQQLHGQVLVEVDENVELKKA